MSVMLGQHPLWTAYTTEPASPSREAVNLLVSWAAADDGVRRSALAGPAEVTG